MSNKVTIRKESLFFVVIALLAILSIIVVYKNALPQVKSQNSNPIPTTKPIPVLIPGAIYQFLKVMDEPLTQIMTIKDTKYKDGYAKSYVFSAIKDQKLVVNAAEDLNSKSSYIKSELYDEEGRLLYDRDTRIEFQAPYTGKYYYIVRTFGEQTGNFVVKIFDQKKVENHFFVLQKNGNKINLNTTESKAFKQVVAFQIEFTVPVETDGDKIAYYDQGDEFNSTKELISSQIRVYSRDNANRELNLGNLRFDPEKEKYRIPVKVEKIDSNTIKISPESGHGFLQNQIVSIEWATSKTSSYGTGFTTEYEY